MDLAKRLSVPVVFDRDEIKTLVEKRVEQGAAHGLRVLRCEIGYDYWDSPKTRVDGLPDVQWRASADRYLLTGLTDVEVDSVLAARLAKTSPAVLGIARNVVTMLEEVNSLFGCLPPEDREGVNGLFDKDFALDQQLQSSLAAACVVVRAAQQQHDVDLDRDRAVASGIEP